MAVVSRLNISSLLYVKKKEPKIFFHIFNLFYAAFCLLALLVNLNLSTIMSISGAILSFFNCFMFPILVQIKV